MSETQSTWLTVVGILFVAVGCFLHWQLKGVGDLVTLVVIIIGAIMIDYKKFSFLKRKA
jgi:hypothetical protein